MQSKLKIDVHTHILPTSLPNFKEKFGYGGFVSMHKDSVSNQCDMMIDGKFFRRVEQNCWDCGARIEECNQKHVDVQVISTVPVMFHYWAQPHHCLETSIFLNDHIAETVASNPKRFVGLGTLPMQSTDLSIKELRRCVDTLGMPGIQIGTHVNQKNLDSPEFLPLFEECERLGASIFIHPWDMLSPERMSKYWMSWLVGMPTETTLAICSMIFGGVFEKFPNLKVCFAHGAGSFPGTIGRIEHGFQVRPDLCAINNKINPRSYIGRFYVDSLVHDDVTLKHLVSLFGANRVMLGTDYPFPLGEHNPGELIESLDFDEQIKNQLLSATALDFLNLKADRFI
eukprot:TRINITY_DN5094_c0_g1_i1.p1 TRINITY_DN5094_c0_g1~~TRINITY_DN5094_c0_g1_i1.p1  ORF type:complete len:341 (-),score=176.03 TRINITY_DN5094_c0_g1_i1:11-1033(-)